MPVECWRQIPGASAYEVSTDGRFRRATPTKQGLNAGLEMLGTIDPHGYRTIHLANADAGSPRSMRAHIAVLLTFVGPRPSPKHDGSHMNGDQLDNRLENLCWETRQDNIRRKEQHGTLIYGSRHKCAKLKEHQIPVIRKLIAEGRLQFKQIAEQFGVSATIINNIDKGRAWVRA